MILFFKVLFQLFNQSSGGWPLTMFLDENAIPFMGEHIFPKRGETWSSRIQTILNSISDVYKNQRMKIIQQADLIKKNLTLKNSVLSQDLQPIIQNLTNQLDETKGGFKGAPKFPNFVFLIH